MTVEKLRLKEGEKKLKAEANESNSHGGGKGREGD
jgi:hypothetical protein